MTKRTIQKLTATALAGALLATATPATAQDYADYKDPNDKYGKFVPGEPDPAFTGSSLTDVLAITGLTLPLLKLLTDNIPPLRTIVDQLADNTGMAMSSGSSVDSRMNGGLDFDLARLARTNGMPELADQITALQNGSSKPAAKPTTDAAPQPAI